ncbi:hypothetical protein N9N67_08690 [Bacteriovoracaceae bacterium]|nr:hypothetical protein [Bacteriovoracaceae bacterium]
MKKFYFISLILISCFSSLSQAEPILLKYKMIHSKTRNSFFSSGLFYLIDEVDDYGQFIILENAQVLSQDIYFSMDKKDQTSKARKDQIVCVEAKYKGEDFLPNYHNVSIYHAKVALDRNDCL